MLDRLESGFTRHFHSITLCSFKLKSLTKPVVYQHKMSHRGGGQKSVKKMSRIIWMAPYLNKRSINFSAFILKCEIYTN